MSVEVGSEITLEIEKPAVGGRMLARHEGQVVLVWGAIPGERVRARVERVARNLLYAQTTEVLDASPERRDAGPDWQCGGNVFAHIAYQRQCQLKADIIVGALERIARIMLPSRPDVLGSPERGYRMRARLHARDGRLGFFREGTHQLCDAASTGQLLPATTEWIAAVERIVGRARLTGLEAIEMAENMRGDERAGHLDLRPGFDAAPFEAIVEAGPLTGLTAGWGERRRVEALSGRPIVGDVLHVRPDDPAAALRLRRDVRAFFQGNRFLLEPLARCVSGLVPAGPVVDLYAGVGLFGLSLAAIGHDEVTLVEGDPVSGASLEENAEPFGTHVLVVRDSVESFLDTFAEAVPPRGTPSSFIVDPPRTGMSKAALAGVIAAGPARIIYVSCDIATFARDTRTLLDAGYALETLKGVDLFPNTAHVETVAAFVNRAIDDR